MHFTPLTETRKIPENGNLDIMSKLRMKLNFRCLSRFKRHMDGLSYSTKVGYLLNTAKFDLILPINATSKSYDFVP